MISSIVLEENILQNAILQIKFRASSVPEFGGFSITPFHALGSNLSCYTNLYFLLLILVGLSGVIWHNRRAEGKYRASLCVPYIVIWVLPFVWVMLFKNHSYGHGSFTYRMFAMTVYGGMSMLILGRDNKKGVI